MKLSLFTLLLIASVASHAASKVGSTLNKKVALDVSEIPAEAMAEIKTIEPGFVVEAAEKEFKHGNVYLDIEGEIGGREIEFDMLQTESGWRVVEVQRDLTWDQLPDKVAEAMKSGAPEFEPKRIIESRQFGTQVTIYEFYAVDADGTESRKEVKLENGVATILQGEWMH